MARAGQILAGLTVGAARAVVVDVGSGGGWAARYLRDADVIAIDLLDVGSPWALGVRGDMSHLPLQDGVADGILFAASLHYGSLDEVLLEAARVLRVDGLLVVVDSPIYSDSAGQVQAAARSAAYYLKSGYPDLADRYHPISAMAFRTALLESGFEIERFEFGSGRSRLWRFRRRPPGTLVVAHRVKRT